MKKKKYGFFKNMFINFWAPVVVKGLQRMNDELLEEENRSADLLLQLKASHARLDEFRQEDEESDEGKLRLRKYEESGAAEYLQAEDGSSDEIKAEVIMALTSLGFSKIKAKKNVEEVLIQFPNLDSENLVLKCLKKGTI